MLRDQEGIFPAILWGNLLFVHAVKTYVSVRAPSDWVPWEFLFSQTCPYWASRNAFMAIQVFLPGPGSCRGFCSHIVLLYTHLSVSSLWGVVVCPVTSLLQWIREELWVFQFVQLFTGCKVTWQHLSSLYVVLETRSLRYHFEVKEIVNSQNYECEIVVQNTEFFLSSWISKRSLFLGSVLYLKVPTLYYWKFSAICISIVFFF